MDFSKEYREEIDEMRKNRVKVSYYKYGPAMQNFATGNVKAIPSMQLCVKKYQDTANTEYLYDAMNYLMFEIMWPQIPGAYFKATDSKDSAGIVGLSVNEAKRFMEEE